MIRLDKYLSERGIGTRSEIEKLIKAGRVAVNGATVTDRALKLNPDTCDVSFDGKKVNSARLRYFAFNKPSGCITATEDRKTETVTDYLPDELKGLGLFPVGRLDKDTEGLLILTNDGDFAHMVISPKYCIKKKYEAVTEGVPNQKDVNDIAAGIVLKDGTKCLPAKLEITGGTTCRITVIEGKYHQVKRMLAACGKPVAYLRRLSIGEYSLPDNLHTGEIVELNEDDLCKILINEKNKIDID